MNQNVIKNHNIIKRHVCILITLCLIGVVYWSHQKSVAAAGELENEKAVFLTAEKEEVHWVAMEKRFTELREQVRLQKYDTARAFHSLRRAKLDDVRVNVMAGAEGGNVIFSARNPGSIWVPEPGHHVEFLFEVNNLDEQDVLEGDFNFPERLRFELKPRQLHTFNFTLKDKRREEKGCRLRFEFDRESQIEMVLQGRHSQSTQPGLNHFEFARTRLLSANGLQLNQVKKVVQRGGWCFLQPTSYTLARKTGKPIEIICQPVIFHPDTYTDGGLSFLLGKAKIRFTEDVDPESPWFGFLKIGDAASEPQVP